MVVCRGDETGNGDYGFRLTRNGSGGPGGEWQGGAKMVLWGKAGGVVEVLGGEDNTVVGVWFT